MLATEVRTITVVVSGLGLLSVLVCLPVLADSSGPGELTPRETVVLQTICAPCHTQPGTGVPLLGDSVEWSKRRAKGLEQLLANTINGQAGMPPLGTCSFCSEDELRRLVRLFVGLPFDNATPAK